MYLGRNLECADFIQQDECYPFLNPAPLELLADAVALHDDVV